MRNFQWDEKPLPDWYYERDGKYYFKIERFVSDWIGKTIVKIEEEDRFYDGEVVSFTFSDGSKKYLYAYTSNGKIGIEYSDGYPKD